MIFEDWIFFASHIAEVKSGAPFAHVPPLQLTCWETPNGSRNHHLPPKGCIGSNESMSHASKQAHGLSGYVPTCCSPVDTNDVKNTEHTHFHDLLRKPNENANNVISDCKKQSRMHLLTMKIKDPKIKLMPYIYRKTTSPPDMSALFLRKEAKVSNST